MSRERLKIVPACYLVLVKGGKILLLRRHNTGYEDGNYSFVAGHLEAGETFREAMAREAREEAGIIIDPQKLMTAHVMQRARFNNDSERVDVFFTIDIWEGELTNNEPDRCDDLRWFKLDELPQNTIPFIAQAIDHIKKGIIYSEFGFK